MHLALSTSTPNHVGGQSQIWQLDPQTLPFVVSFFYSYPRHSFLCSFAPQNLRTFINSSIDAESDMSVSAEMQCSRTAWIWLYNLKQVKQLATVLKYERSTSLWTDKNLNYRIIQLYNCISKLIIPSRNLITKLGEKKHLKIMIYRNLVERIMLILGIVEKVENGISSQLSYLR